MKRPLGVFFVCLVFIGQTGFSATLLNFEDLSPGTGTVVLQNGYGGLNWLGFGVLAGTQYPTSGYYTGMVSPSNVAYNFDQYDRHAYISSSTPFNFNSAYLTATVDYYTSGLSNGVPYQVHGMQVEVQGYIGATLAYDNIYPIQESSPTLASFNYLGVTEVEFIPETPGVSQFNNAMIFAMDNVSVTLVPEPGILGLLAMGAGLGGLGVWRRKADHAQRAPMVQRRSV